MSLDSVHWGDGLFLRPHHFQALERRSGEELAQAESWLAPYRYGIRRIEIDRDALSNWMFSLGTCHVRLPNGTMLRCPESATLVPTKIPRELFSSPDSRVMVYVGVPALRQGMSNVVETTNKETARYTLYSRDVEDENRAGNPQPLEFRRLNAQILFGADAAKGFDAVPIVRLKLGSVAEAPPESDTRYIPPLLDHHAWPPLQRFIRSIYDRLGATSQKLGQQMIDRGVAFTSGHKEDFERILRLHAVNSALGGLSAPALLPGCHPFVAYQELCRTVGQLAVFRQQRQFPELPLYDHDNLAPVFSGLGKLLETEDATPSYVSRPFRAEGLQMSVQLERAWLEPSWSFYIGVKAPIATDHVTDLLSERTLGMKVGCVTEVDGIYREGRRGLRFEVVSDAPRAFPREDWHYYRVERSAAWRSVERSLKLGIRFNEQNVVKQSEGENEALVKAPGTGNQVPLGFSLFAIEAT